MDSLLQKGRKRRIGCLILAGLLPMLMCFFFSLLDARQNVRDQQRYVATALLKQAETISARAWLVTAQLNNSGKDCQTLNPLLQNAAASSPFFRSIGVIKDGAIICSSAYSSQTYGSAITLLFRLQGQSSRYVHTITSGSDSSKATTLIFVNTNPDGNGVYALLDGQYLDDFMNALTGNHDYSLSLQFAEGEHFSHGNNRPDTYRLLGGETVTLHSAQNAIQATVKSPDNEVLLAWRQSLCTFLPMTAIFTLLLIIAADAWLKRKYSFGDKIRQAIAENKFSVNYQPLCHSATGMCAGVEALMRWQLPNHNWANPDRFISAAENEGMIVPLTQHLLRLVIADLQNVVTPPGFHISVNVAAAHLHHDDFVSDIRFFHQSLAKYQPEIIIELTERSLISNHPSVIEKLHQLRAEGVFIAIDDFGTGHCSLSYLQTFPLDYLKIDRRFIQAIESLDAEAPILDAIINLSHKLKLTIIAEGIETAVQRDYLLARGVTFIQGYFFARPMSPTVFTHWLTEKKII
ncbi:MAG: putative cyclic di-GMP phosphodiesterase PdeN [Candidatus Erwinia impunctatus]|nr:putative cyclic di-GMP phosphodiesterase PdeN [Culicoides impunctatus]